MERASATTFTMDWNNIQFKAKDIILLLVYVISASIFFNRMANSIDKVVERQEVIQQQFNEFKNDSKDGSEKTQLFWQSLQNQVNTNTTQIKLQDQRIAVMEQTLSRK